MDAHQSYYKKPLHLHSLVIYRTSTPLGWLAKCTEGYFGGKKLFYLFIVRKWRRENFSFPACSPPSRAASPRPAGSHGPTARLLCQVSNSTEPALAPSCSAVLLALQQRILVNCLHKLTIILSKGTAGPKSLPVPTPKCLCSVLAGSSQWLPALNQPSRLLHIHLNILSRCYFRAKAGSTLNLCI